MVVSLFMVVAAETGFVGLIDGGSFGGMYEQGIGSG